MSMSPLEIKKRIDALEWEIQNNEEENDMMRNEIKLLEKKLEAYETDQERVGSQTHRD